MALLYSCCFWFSLRLGGILIAMFSILQALTVLVSCCVAYAHKHYVKDSIAAMIGSLNLIYAKSYLDSFHSDLENYLSLCISFTCIYIIICLFYAYGAYKFNNILMMGFILIELLRLIFLAFIITTWLLVLKENTMDIGIHIGTSVIGSFFLLGMFYLWTCAANLPILINEMERDQQIAMIHKLQSMVDIKNTMALQGWQDAGAVPLATDVSPYRKSVFSISNIQRSNIFRQTLQKNSHNLKPFYGHPDH